MNLIEIGGRIKAQRRNMGISQEKLSEMIFVSPHYIYEIERGTKAMSLETLMNMSEALNLSTDYILFGSIENDAPQELTARITDIFDTFDGCSDYEIYLMLSVAKSAKAAVRQRNSVNPISSENNK